MQQQLQHGCYAQVNKEELEKEKLNNSPFKDLDKLIGKERQKWQFHLEKLVRLEEI